MHAHKITIFALAALLAVGCGPQNVTDSPEVEDLKNELAELRKSDSELKQKYIEQNMEMSMILNELASITGMTSDLRIDVEKGAARLTQAEQISKNIERIKTKIAALEKSFAAIGGKNKEFQKMIDGLNKVIEEQEAQINVLKLEIEAKDQTIQYQRDTINMQVKTIEKQMLELERTVAHQAELLYKAGQDLENIGDQTPEVSWKKNKEKVDAMRQNLYRQALEYYRQAYAAGYEPAKAKTASILSKIQAQ